MSKIVNFDPRPKMLKGLNFGADAISGTIGPKGRNVWIDDQVSPKFTNDGFSIARSITLKDPEEESGNKIIKNACGQTVDDAGDGTTTTAIITQATVHEAIKRPENSMSVRQSLLEASAKIVKEIKKVSIPINKEDIFKVALISAEDKELATSIGEIFQKIGEHAVVTVEDSYDPNISYEIISGYEATVGFMDSRFADEKDKKARCTFLDVPVLVSEKKISTVSDISPLWEKFKMAGQTSCVIVCDDIESSILGTFVLNKKMGTFMSVVIRATGDMLKDIEAATGATRISDTTGITFQNVDFNHLGRAKKVISDANKTLFLPEDPSKSEQYATHLEKFKNDEANWYVKQKLEKRISQLRGGIAVLRIGTQDFNREYLKDKADDAIKACKAALEEGVVEGGGMCLWRIAQNLKGKTVGEQILKNALREPFKKICENAGKDYAEVLLTIRDWNVGQNEDALYGYDARNDTYVPLIENGIIDPAKVTRCAVENAVSNAANFITMFCSITDEPPATK